MMVLLSNILSCLAKILICFGKWFANQVVFLDHAKLKNAELNRLDVDEFKNAKKHL